MKKTNTPRTSLPNVKRFDLTPGAWCFYPAALKVFTNQPHSSYFCDMIIKSDDYQRALEVSYFIPDKPVKRVSIVIEYE